MSAALYERLWANADYRRVAPGEQLAYRFVEMAKPSGTVVDFGCGTGRGAALIVALSGAKVIGLDFAANCLDPDSKASIEFRQHDLREPLDFVADYGYCTDVLEHIAPEDVDTVLLNVLQGARRVFLAISTVPDHFGKTVGEPLHLTVQSHSWWREKLEALECRIYWQHEAENAAMFYVSGYASGQDYLDRSVINVEHDRIVANVRANVSLGLQECAPHGENTQHVYLLAGGPSLGDFEAQIVADAKAGTPIVTTNGAYNWCLERGIQPAAQIVTDARAFNARFVTPTVANCKYLISSQTDHDLVASLPREQTWLWHADTPLIQEALEGHQHWPVYGGSTVILRALPLLAMLGFRKVEVFGWDSCLREDSHHAYAQPENDGMPVVEVIVGGRTFKCHPWMVIQGHETQTILRALARVDGFEMAVHGDGLIAHILATAAMSAERKQ